MCVCLCVWVSCQVEHLAVCSQLDHVADGGHQQSQVTGLSTIKITPNVGVCEGVWVTLLVYVWLDVCMCGFCSKNMYIYRDRYWFILQRDREGESWQDILRLWEHRMGTKMSENRGEQTTEVENRKQMGRRDSDTVKSPWQLPDFAILPF